MVLIFLYGYIYFLYDITYIKDKHMKKYEKKDEKIWKNMKKKIWKKG